MEYVFGVSLTIGTTLYILGYPYGMSLQEQGNLKPFFSKSTVAQDGTVNNCIHVNDRNFDHGNSGGPVFAEKDGKYYAATGTKGYRWLEADMVRELGREDDIDRGYYNKLVDSAVEDISKFGDIEWFMQDGIEGEESDDQK